MGAHEPSHSVTPAAVTALEELQVHARTAVRAIDVPMHALNGAKQLPVTFIPRRLGLRLLQA